MEFKVGDRVIFDNLNPDVPNDPGIEDEMEDMLGGEYIIRAMYDDYIELEDDEYDYGYAPEWFRHVGTAPKPKPVPVVVSAKNIAKQLVALRKDLRARASRGVSNYGLVIKGEDGTLTNRLHISDICHARMRVEIPLQVVAAVDFLGAPDIRFKDDQEKKNYLAYADYIINRSSARFGFKKCTRLSYLRSGVRVNVEESATSVMYSLIALRVGNEKKYILALYTLLREKGFSEGMSFLIANSFKKGEPNKGEGEGYVVCLHGNHSPIDSMLSLKNAKNIINDAPLFKPMKPYREFPKGWEIFDNLSLGGGGYWGTLVNRVTCKHAKTEIVWGEPQALPINEETMLTVAKEIEAELLKIKEPK